MTKCRNWCRSVIDSRFLCILPPSMVCFTRNWINALRRPSTLAARRPAPFLPEVELVSQMERKSHALKSRFSFCQRASSRHVTLLYYTALSMCVSRSTRKQGDDMSEDCSTASPKIYLSHLASATALPGGRVPAGYGERHLCPPQSECIQEAGDARSRAPPLFLWPRQTECGYKG